jgi:hypothetical protein
MTQLDPIIAKETPPLFWLSGFDGVNLHDDRRSIGDEECAWLENFAPLGKGNARAMYDNAVAIYTASGLTIVYDFPFNVGSTFYHALFFSDGSARQIAVVGGAVTLIAAASTFSVAPTLPACAQWGASGIVIVTADTNGYFAWDGTLYSPNTAAPGWLSGLAAPLTPTGTTNTSTSVTAVSDTTLVVIGMNITDTTNADIPANTTVAGTTSNTITLSQAAVGSHVADTLSINWFMPTGIKGSAVEVFQSRVWILNGAQFQLSAPSNGADFSTVDGGLITKSSDGFLKATFVNLKQSNGFLYLFGDGSVNVVSNVQTSGSPATTTFNNQNVDPQTGLGWRDALVPFGRALCFANPTGVYTLFGGAAEKISDKIDKLFEKANFTAVVPTMFVTSIFGVRCLGLILNTLDPTTTKQRTLLCLWNSKKWFIASQTLTGIFSTTMEINANPQGWANDGTHLYQLFQTKSSTLQKKVQSKLWPGRSNLIKKDAKDVYVESADLGGTGVILTGTLDSDTNASVAFTITSNIFWINGSGGIITFVNNASQALQFITSPPGIQTGPANQAGQRLGLTLTSTSPDFELIGMGETYDEQNFLGR